MPASLQAGGLRSGSRRAQGGCLPGRRLLTVSSHGGWKALGGSLGAFVRTLTPFMGPTPSQPSCLPKAPRPNTITSGGYDVNIRSLGHTSIQTVTQGDWSCVSVSFFRLRSKPARLLLLLLRVCAPEVSRRPGGGRPAWGTVCIFHFSEQCRARPSSGEELLPSIRFFTDVGVFPDLADGNQEPMWHVLDLGEAEGDLRSSLAPRSPLHCGLFWDGAHFHARLLLVHWLFWGSL